ncbi:hypothetical protein AB1I15_08485 [Streptococcus dysgalactiae subsp. equisimilis]|uniref:hypothetical protein n=1 Tax=Streptococcus dysgalactiae TaxID=1334 RepID=UPI00080717A8|nr:hypothetical protein [Streptococcus dysgalactiae]MCY7219511.1 hypothetical protein [Streptococcus dysgalactiae]MCY7227887.1 hypothetical protein [Streptococcus dysgalactiae]OBZ02445.1 hypothetical protein BBG05_07735 [Streptococcus dysgalactiae subsp. equisimilis]QQC50314.1 hypothetical protein I6H74_03885 [Streptococcus dysgalactiae]TYL02498.1 hypothetical protein E0F72_03115 [Streptococcus dysgalactiae]
MQKSKKEALYLLLSIFTITLMGGLYLVFASTSKMPTPLRRQEQAVDLAKQADLAVQDAEKLGTIAATNKAQHAIDRLKASSKKQGLQDRLEAVKATLEQEAAATRAVKSAEDAPSPALKDLAQKAVNELNNFGKKAALQARLDAIVLAKPVPEETPRQVIDDNNTTTWIPDPEPSQPHTAVPQPSSPQTTPESSTPSPAPEPSQPEPSHPSTPSLPTPPIDSGETHSKE